MIQASELRRGNFVLPFNTKTPCRIAGILGGNIFLETISYGYNEEDIDPIPLSFEVFTDNIAITDVEAASNIKEEHMFAINVNDRISLKWHKTRGVWLYIRNESYPLKHIEYLHQLQNLYADLKGQQLEINLTDAQVTK